MYAHRHVQAAGLKPASLVVAVAINAAVIGALLFSTPVIEAIRDKPPLTIINIPIDPPPPPVPEPRPSPDQRAASRPDRVATSSPVVPTTADTFVALPPLPLPPLPPLPLPTLPNGSTTAEPPRPDPVLAEARVDPRYARYLQPAYPPGERRAEREGLATVRVTIGSDGRVIAAECVTATTAAFCDITRAQALSKWRFMPGTRDGAAIESVKVMTVRFRLES